MTLATNSTIKGAELDCNVSLTQRITKNSDLSQALTGFVQEHKVFGHPLFAALQSRQITAAQAGRLLKNYDAHASHLRRLLLKAATIMPESAVGFILENVRNEYGNGIDAGRHQLQLQDVAFSAGSSQADYHDYSVDQSVKLFIKEVTPLYFPVKQHTEKHDTAMTRKMAKLSKAAIAAGAITATELMAVEEFKALQIAFKQFDLQDHIWFDHVTVEQEHSGESIALALYFLNQNLFDAVEFGLKGVLDANIHLYDGLLATIS